MRAKGGIGSGETLCHDIYPDRPITTVSLAANTYCMMDGFSSHASCAVGPKVQFSGACEQRDRPCALQHSDLPLCHEGRLCS